MELQRTEALATKRRMAKGAYDFRDLMSKVTSYLDVKDLRSVAQTCRIWRNAVAREMQFRCLQRVLVYEEENVYVLQNFVRVNPHLVMLFAKHDFRRKVRREQTLCQQYMKQFPNMLITLGFDDVLSEANVINIDLPQYDENRNFVYFHNCEVPGLLVPYHSSTEIKMVKFQLKDIKTTCWIPTMFSSLVPKNPDEKSVVLVFTYGLHRNIYLDSIMKSFEKYFRKNESTLWGGELFQPPCVHHSQSNESDNSDHIGFIAVSITDPNLRSYSLVLDIEDIESENVYEEIYRFGKGIKFRSQSIGLFIGPEFEDFQMESDDEQNDALTEDDSGFFKMNYEKKIMYYLKKVFPRVHFISLFQDSLLRVFGIADVRGQQRYYHAKTISLVILTHN